jgi:hypothetical protein
MKQSIMVFDFHIIILIKSLYCNYILNKQINKYKLIFINESYQTVY